jgi:Ca2+-binding RTX toxin-like protein
MFVDFSDLPDGGILGDVTWNSDIDTLKYLGDLAPAGTSDAYAANDIVMGTAADDFLNGAGGEDVFTGSAGNDVLTGGSGADAFIFMDGSGEDVIVDFDILGGDILNIQAFGFADPDAVLTVSTDVGSDVLIQLDANDSVMLTDVTTAELSATDHWLLSL